MTEVLVAVEGLTDVPVAESLVRVVGRTPRVVAHSIGSPGIDHRLKSWNRPSNRSPMLVLRDWDDRDGVACAPELLTKILGGRSLQPTVAVRVAVRATESWLMADPRAKQFFGISVPREPDLVANPKLELVKLCRKSTKRSIRDGMVPSASARKAVGDHYATLVQEFGREHWSPTRARANSPSLDRALSRLEQLVAEGTWP